MVDPLAVESLAPLGAVLADPDGGDRVPRRGLRPAAARPRVRLPRHRRLRHPDRGAAPQRAGRRPGGPAREVPGRAARQAVPAGRLVGPAALARDARVRGVGHPLPARAARHPQDAARGARPAGLGRGGVRAARRHPLEPADGEPGYLRLKGAKALKGRELAILRELYEWREGVAQRSDRATFRILNNEPMLAMATTAARATWRRSRPFPGIGGEQAERRGREILAAVQARPRRSRTRSCPGSSGRRAGPTTPRSRRGSSGSRRRGTSSPTRLDLAAGSAVPERDARGDRPGESRTGRGAGGGAGAAARWQLREIGADLLAAVNGTGERDKGRQPETVLSALSDRLFMLAIWRQTHTAQNPRNARTRGSILSGVQYGSHTSSTSTPWTPSRSRHHLLHVVDDLGAGRAARRLVRVIRTCTSPGSLTSIS